ncbi:MAG: hypothetical protein ACU84Q_21775 [Gammaproteobacteria bacterium]
MPRLLLSAAFVLVLALFAFNPGSLRADETASIVRDTVLRTEASFDSAEIMKLVAGAEIIPLERIRLWVRVSTAAANPKTGWVRLNYLRGRPAAAATEPSRSNPFAGFSRSVSGFLSGFRSRRAPQPTQTATIGIRGLTSEELTAARPDHEALAAVAQYASSEAAAESFAESGGLTERNLDGS